MKKYWNWLFYNPQGRDEEPDPHSDGVEGFDFEEQPAPPQPAPPPPVRRAPEPAPPPPVTQAQVPITPNVPIPPPPQAPPVDSIGEYVPAIEEALEAALPAGLPSPLHAAMRDALLAGGKRLRPALLLCACEALGGDGEKALPYAVALECIHAYSLVHDDLPCMDDDDFRRGKPSCHKVHGQAMALLAGDALLSLAQQLLTGAITGRDSQKAAHTIAKAALQMAAGQAWDIAPPTAMTDTEFFKLHAGKTGALFAAAAQAGALLAGQPQEICDTLRAFGADVGMAFQITDDCLDYETSDSYGADIGSDSFEADRTGAGRPTFPVRFGLQKSRDMADKMARRAADRLEPLGVAMTPLRRFALAVPERDT